MLKRLRGYTLTELTVAMGLGAFLLTGLLVFFAGLLDMQARMLRRQYLHQELTALMTVIIHDIRRAGFWGRAGHTPSPNPFATLHTGRHCLLYAYDEDGDGRAESAERRGFRLANGTLQARTRAPLCAGGDCGDCEAGRWWRLSDPARVRILRLEFRERRRPLSATGTMAPPGELLGLEIHLEGALSAFPGEPAALQAAVHLPNLVPAP